MKKVIQYVIAASLGAVALSAIATVVHANPCYPVCRPVYRPVCRPVFHPVYRPYGGRGW